MLPHFILCRSYGAFGWWGGDAAPRLRTPNGALAVAWIRPAANAACLTRGHSGAEHGIFSRASSRTRRQRREGDGAKATIEDESDGAKATIEGKNEGDNQG